MDDTKKTQEVGLEKIAHVLTWFDDKETVNYEGRCPLETEDGVTWEATPENRNSTGHYTVGA